MTTHKPQHSPELDLAQFEGFTPGPWRHGSGNISNTIEAYSGRKVFDGDTGFRSVATYQACEATHQHKNEEANAAANARLIAAAPALLSEVKRLRSENERMRQAAKLVLGKWNEGSYGPRATPCPFMALLEVAADYNAPQALAAKVTP